MIPPSPVAARAVAVAGVVLLLAPVSVLAEGHETPEAAFDAAGQAIAAKDWKTLGETIAPSERPLMAFELDLAVGMMAEVWEGDDAAKARELYDKARADFAVSEENAGGEPLEITSDTPEDVIDAHVEKRARAIFANVDTAGYISTLLGIMMSSPMMEGQSIPFPAPPLAELAIDGDRATGQAEGRTISFVREGGRWYLSADAIQ